ncbi:MAG: hypothetical protein HEQ32_06425 [Vampirovibrio sp.]
MKLKVSTSKSMALRMSRKQTLKDDIFFLVASFLMMYALVSIAPDALTRLQHVVSIQTPSTANTPLLAQEPLASSEML